MNVLLNIAWQSRYARTSLLVAAAGAVLLAEMGGPHAADEPTQASVFRAQRVRLEYKVTMAAVGMELGRISHEYEVIGSNYRIRSVTEATGLAAMLHSGKVIQESAGTVSPEGLRPDRYSVQRPAKLDQVVFDWKGLQAHIDEGGRQRDWKLEAGAQDLLSVLHQMAFHAAQRRGADFSITNGRKFYPVRVTWLGEEDIETGLGPMRTVHLRSEERGEDTALDVWIAPGRGHLPVRIRVKGGDGTVEQVASRILEVP